MFDLEDEGQGHGLQHSQWCHSMANISIYKRSHYAFLHYSQLFRC